MSRRSRRAARACVDKMPSNFLYCGLIRLILPDARIVHCRRDPVDTCLSCYTKLFVGEQTLHLRSDRSSGAITAPTRRSWRIGAASCRPRIFWRSTTRRWSRTSRARPGAPRFSRLAVGRGLPALPRDEAARAHRERQSGPAAALFDLRGALAQARGAIGSAARGARRFGPSRLGPHFIELGGRGSESGKSCFAITTSGSGVKAEYRRPPVLL